MVYYPCPTSRVGRSRRLLFGAPSAAGEGEFLGGVKGEVERAGCRTGLVTRCVKPRVYFITDRKIAATDVTPKVYGAIIVAEHSVVGLRSRQRSSQPSKTDHGVFGDNCQRLRIALRWVRPGIKNFVVIPLRPHHPGQLAFWITPAIELSQHASKVVLRIPMKIAASG